MRFALARKLGWSSTIRTVLPMPVILAHGRARVHGATHTAAFGRPTPGEARAQPQDTCPQHGLGDLPLTASRHVRIRRRGGLWMSVMAIATPAAASLERSPAAAAPAVALREVRQDYGKGDNTVVALDGVTTDLARGSFTAIMGPSGSGKSTFLHVAAGLDRPTSGTVALGGVDLAGLSERRLTLLRREHVGFVFQAFNLMPSLTVTQNIGLPLPLDGRRPRRSEVREVAARVGLDDRLRHRPSELSGGQQQRVAIARALITRPEVVFACEPTGALDSHAGRRVLGLLREVVDADGHTVVMVTHDPAAAAHADRVILLADGRIAGTLEAPDADEVAEHLAHLGS